MDISLLDQGHSCDFRGEKFFCSPLLSFIDWLFMWKMVWRRLWAFHLSLCASQNNLCCFSVHPRPQREPEGPSGCFFFTALPTAVEHQTLTPCFSKVNYSGQLLLERNCSLGSASKPPCQLYPRMCFYILYRVCFHQSNQSFWGTFWGMIASISTPQEPWGGSECSHWQSTAAPHWIRTFVWVLEGWHQVQPERATSPNPRFQRTGSKAIQRQNFSRNFCSPENSQDTAVEIGGRLDFQSEGGKKPQNQQKPQHFSSIIKAKAQWRDCIKMFLADQFMLLYISSHFSAGTQRMYFTHLVESLPLNWALFCLPCLEV